MRERPGGFRGFTKRHDTKAMEDTMMFFTTIPYSTTATCSDWDTGRSMHMTITVVVSIQEQNKTAHMGWSLHMTRYTQTLSTVDHLLGLQYSSFTIITQTPLYAVFMASASFPCIYSRLYPSVLHFSRPNDDTLPSPLPQTTQHLTLERPR